MAKVRALRRSTASPSTLDTMVLRFFLRPSPRISIGLSSSLYRLFPCTTTPRNRHSPARLITGGSAALAMIGRLTGRRSRTFPFLKRVSDNSLLVSPSSLAASSRKSPMRTILIPLKVSSRRTSRSRPARRPTLQAKYRSSLNRGANDVLRVQ